MWYCENQSEVKCDFATAERGFHLMQLNFGASYCLRPRINLEKKQKNANLTGAAEMRANKCREAIKM